MKLLPRDPEGLWMFWRGGTTGDVLHQALDKQGAIVSEKGSLYDTAQFYTWTAGSDGSRMVFAGTKLNDGSNKLGLHVRLYTASNRYVAEVSDFDAECVFDAVPRHVALAPGLNGTTHIALTVAMLSGPRKVDGSCDMDAVDKRVVAYFRTASADGALTPPVQLDFGRLVRDPRVVRVPCASEWLVAEVNKDAQIFRRVGFDGRLIATHDGVLRGTDFWDLEAVPDTSCASGNSDFYVLASPPAATKSFATQLSGLRLDRTAGTLVEVLPALDLSATPLSEAQVLHRGGRMFVSGLDHRAVLHLLEVTTSAVPKIVPLNTVEVSALPGDGLYVSGLNNATHQMTSLAWAGDVLVVGTAMTPQFAGANELRDPGDLDPAVAVTYNVGCN